MTDSARSHDIDDLLAEAGWVASLVRGIVRDADLADDVVQETMLQALRRPPESVHGVSSVRSWLGTVARRVALRWTRSDAARRRREREVARSEAFDPEVYSERLRLQRRVAAYVLALDEPHRTAVILRYQEGLTPREIAQKLGISNAAARKRVSRGLERLQRRFEREHGEGRDGWIAVLLPLLRAPDPAPASPTGSGAVSSVSWIAAAALVFGGVAFWSASREEAVDRPRSEPVAVAAGVSEAQEETGSAGRVKSSPTRSAPVRPRESGEALVGRITTEHGLPIAGALVAAFPVAPGAHDPDDRPNRRPIAEGKSDAGGVFRLALGEGTIADLLASAPGFGTEWLPERRGADRIDIVLHDAAAVDVRVDAPDGSPFVGVPVRVVRWWMADGVTRDIAHGITGADGACAFGELPPGRFVLEAAVAGDTIPPCTFSLEPGEHRRTTLVATKGLVVRGEVIDAVTGLPIPGAEVVGRRARPPSAFSRDPVVHRGDLGGSWADLPPAHTDARGRFEVVVPSDLGFRQVHVHADGYAPTASVPGDVRSPDLRIALERGWSIDAVLLDEAGVPVSGLDVAVTASGARNGIEQGDRRSGCTKVDGSVRFENLRPDLPYSLSVGARSGFAETCVWRGRRASGEVERLRLTVPKGQRLAGAVVDAAGRPKAGLWVAIVDANGHRRRVRCDGLGRFVCLRLPPGETTIAAGGEERTVVIASGSEPDDVRLRVTGDRVVGVVSDELGTPILHAMVVLVPVDHSRRSRRFVTDADGRFRFDGVPPSAHELVVAPNSIHRPGGNRMVHQVVYRDVWPGPETVAVVLPPAATVRGTVVDARGEVCPNTPVFARSADGHLMTYEITDSEGRFLLRLPPDSVVDLAVGQAAPHRIVARGVRAGARGVRLVRR